MGLVLRGLLLFWILILVGCAEKSGIKSLTEPFKERPTKDEIKEAYQKNKFGKKPDNYMKVIKKYMEDKLYDPYSAVYSDWTEPFRAWIYNKMMDIAVYGWGVCVNINAKNLHGAYTGKRKYFFLIKNGKVYGYRYGIEAEKLCRKFLSGKH